MGQCARARQSGQVYVLAKTNNVKQHFWQLTTRQIDTKNAQYCFS